MISIVILNEYFAAKTGLDKTIYRVNHPEHLGNLGLLITMNADYIFYYQDGKTHYYKDRSGDSKQFSEEEISIMVLKSSPLKSYQ